MGLFERLRRSQPAVRDDDNATTESLATNYFSEGNAAVGSGRLADALDAFQKSLAAKPDFSDAELAIGRVQQQLGRQDEAVASYRRALRLNPSHHDVYGDLGDALMALGQFEDASANYSRAIEAGIESEMSHFRLGNALMAQARLDGAAASYMRALDIKPDFAAAHCNLANALRGMGRTNDALASYQRAVQIAPHFAEAHYNLAVTLQGVSRSDDAIASYVRALQAKPHFPQAHNNLGLVYARNGRIDEAVASFRSALQSDPNFADAHNNLGTSLKESGRLAESESSYRRAIEIRPDLAEAHSNLANVLADRGLIGEALKYYDRAITIKPDYVEAHSNRGDALSKLWQLDAAIASYRQALQINPNYFGAHNNLGNALQELGRYREAAASYRLALESKPDYSQAQSNLLFCISHDADVDKRSLFAEHSRFGARFEDTFRASWPQHTNDRDTERCLRIGFVSGDLRDHAVAYFLEPVLEYLAVSRTLSLHAYYNHATDESITPRLRGYFSSWQRIVELGDAALATKISADAIDILVDLSGHTSENRLLCFARKPAPIQASWMGYPGTTGLKSMDYYFADRYFLPPGRFDDQFTEKLVYLPALAPFLPDKRAPAVNALPASSNGYITFGSFNRLGKVTAPAVALWSRLLQAIPDSRMVIGGMPQESQTGMLKTWFAEGSVDRNRLTFRARCDVPNYLAMHAQVDVCLDTFPYTGGTTVNHALWMGVPTLTLAGNTVPGRQGAAMLGHVGLDAFIANDAEEFLAKGRYWASDLPALSAIRSGLRERCAQSPIRRPELVAAGLENAFRTMWKRWCSGQEAASFAAMPQREAD